MSFLVFDLETVPDPAWVPPTDKPDPFPPPWAHRIVAIGFAAMSYEFELIKCGSATGPNAAAEPDPERRERALIGGFSATVRAMDAKARTLVTFNGRKFDLPVLMARSMRHAVAMDWYLANEQTRKRYAMKSHVDLYDQLSDYGAASPGNFDVLAKTIGLPGKTGVSGADVAKLWAAGDEEAVKRYVLDDVAQTAVMMLRFAALRGTVAKFSDMNYHDSVLTRQLKLIDDFRKHGAFAVVPFASAEEDFG